MALFSRKKKEPTDAAVVPATQAKATDRNLSGVLLQPRLTEKAMNNSDHNVYTFVVRRDATKFQIRDAVKALYNVTPVKINTVTKAPAKRLKGSQNRMVKVPGMKKAYVYLKKGDSISLV
jgi:large subunit ribosomal protein L23